MALLEFGTGNSRIVYATSPSPDGVYTRQAEIEGPFAHEPSVARAPNGTWVMYFARHFPNSTKTDGFAPCNCTNGSTPEGACTREVAHSSHVTFMVTATTLGGPWSSPRMIPLLDCNLVRAIPTLILTRRGLTAGFDLQRTTLLNSNTASMTWSWLEQYCQMAHFSGWSRCTARDPRRIWSSRTTGPMQMGTDRAQTVRLATCSTPPIIHRMVRNTIFCHHFRQQFVAKHTIVGINGLECME